MTASPAPTATSQANAGASAPDITTAGWDTVFALRLSQVNDLIAAAVRRGDLTLPRLDWSEDQAGFSAPLIGFAFVGDPDLSGSQALVRMTFGPGKLTYIGAYAASGADLIGTLNLRRIDDPKFVSLSVQPARDFVASRVDNLTLTDATGAPCARADVHNAYLKAAQAAIQADLTAFAPVLAQVSLQSALPDKARWLAPVAVGHCIAGGRDATGDADKGSTLAVLCMTDPFIKGNPLPPPSFDSRLIPPGCEAAFLISGPKFTRNLLFTGLAQTLFSPGVPLTPDKLADIERNSLQIVGEDVDQTISTRPGVGETSLGEIQADVSPLYGVFAEALLMPWLLPGAVLTLLGTVVGEMIAHGGHPNLIVPVEVRLTSLEVTRTGDSVHFRSGIHCPVNIGQLNVANITMTTDSTYRLVADKGGFQFVLDSSFVSSKDVGLPDWLKDGQTVAEVIATIVGLIITVVTDGEAALLLTVAIGILAASVESTPQLIAQGIAQGAGVAVPADFGGFVDVAVSPVSWLQAASFDAQALQLGEALLFAGALSSKA
ncbi:MAG: hypothetical protein AB1942_10370 [Pseudomonadota bacterium]